MSLTAHAILSLVTTAASYVAARHGRQRAQREKSRLHAWQKRVFARYGRKCDICGSRERVAAHHTFDKTTYPDKRFRVSLGRPLCYLHHRGRKGGVNGFHVWMGGTHVSCTMGDYKLYKRMISEGSIFPTKAAYLNHIAASKKRTVTLLRVMLAAAFAVALWLKYA